MNKNFIAWIKHMASAKMKRNMVVMSKRKTPGAFGKAEVLRPEKKTAKEIEVITDGLVTDLRLSNVLKKFPKANTAETGKVIKNVFKSIEMESEGSIFWTKEIRLSIKKRCVLKLKKIFQNKSK